MAMYYGPQAAQVNEESVLESFLDLTLTQHPRDENLEPWEVRTRFEVDPPRTWYYCIFLNFHTLVILLQINLASHDELEIIYESYETKDTFIFVWSLVPNVGHYCCLRDTIRRLLHNNKTNYLIRTIWCILDFL